MDKVRIQFLGSGDAFGSGGRFQPCLHLSGPSEPILRATVTPFIVKHASGAPAYALRVEYGGKVITYLGDTEWTESLIEAARGADLFVCEAYFFEKKIKYHLDYQTLRENRERLDCRRI